MYSITQKKLLRMILIGRLLQVTTTIPALLVNGHFIIGNLIVKKPSVIFELYKQDPTHSLRLEEKIIGVKFW